MSADETRPQEGRAYNPIEEAFSKIKEILRRAAARSREALTEAIGRALEPRTPVAISNMLDTIL